MYYTKNDSYMIDLERRYSTFLKQFPDNDHILRKRAFIRLNIGVWRRAVRDLEELVKRMPENDELWWRLGMACAHGKLPEKAIQACSSISSRLT